MNLSLRTSKFSAATAALGFAILLATDVSAQAPTAREVLDKGVAVTGLTGADVPAWHMKANYTLSDMKGKPTSTGTLEEWYTGPYTWHRLYTEKKASANEWSVTHSKQFKMKDDKLKNLSMLDDHVATILVNPLYQAANFKPDVQLDGLAGTFSGQILNCVTAAHPAAAAGKIDPNVLFPRLCFDAKDNTLRYSNTPTTLITYTDFKPMGSHQTATKVTVNSYGKIVADLEITSLEPLSEGDKAQVAPPSSAAPQPYTHQPGDDPLVPVRITECQYPISALSNKEVDTVSISILIKKDGSVKSTGAFSPNQYYDLAGAGQDCVSNWKFEPFKLDGEAIDVADTVLYTFDPTKKFNGQVVLASEPAPPPAK